MHAAESINHPTKLLDHQGIFYLLGLILQRSHFTGHASARWSNTIKHILEYSKRQLSYESDALGDFLGILYSLERHEEESV